MKIYAYMDISCIIMYYVYICLDIYLCFYINNFLPGLKISTQFACKLRHGETQKALDSRRPVVSTHRVNSFMQSLLQKVSFYLCLHSMNNKDKMIPSAAVTA